MSLGTGSRGGVRPSPCFGCQSLFGLLVCTCAATGGQPRGPSVPGVESACWRGRRLRSRRLACARGSRHAAFVFGGRSHPPAARGPEKPVGGRDGSRYVWFVVEGSDCSRLVCLLIICCFSVPSFTEPVRALLGGFEQKKTHRNQADASLYHQPKALRVKTTRQPCSPAPPER